MPDAAKGDAADSAELGMLCQSCAMCCDGSLFGRVELEPDEALPAKRRGLLVLHDAKGFEQPCSALSGPGRGDRRCSIYDERPRSCRRFTCRLYERHRREGGPIDQRLEVVRRVRVLAARLEASGFTPADFGGARSGRAPSDGEADVYRELMRSLEEDFARA